ncbi:AraC family transcriptional regulator [Pleionea sp. CnH1-48]|uniref:helix-turn-helix domain-containing protein n=1 Tax=Pleionea sp. CnH1-48 TaxID=2954494 RepID=UPI0020976E93|nr:AraC family transcriptional regulator [Pleionea sp. CnH1-48]MCO7224208.1 AraC family transcriptional regulator [Pleionea sp. CnH1-48]
MNGRHSLCNLLMTHQLNHLLYEGQHFNIGMFDCPVTWPDFRNTGPIKDGYLLAFPRTAVKIRHAHCKDTIVADANIVTVYNKNQEYERFPLSHYGDRCDWIAFSPTLVTDTLRALGDSVAEEQAQLFRFRYCASSSQAYAQFRQLVLYLQQTPTPDPLFIEESIIHLFYQIMQSAYRDWQLPGQRSKPSTQRRHATLVNNAREILATEYRQSLSLEQLAQMVNSSPYHLCRVYKATQGDSIHQSLVQLRLRDALTQVAESQVDFSTIAADVGFSDHSHFTQSFRKAFGMTPALWRQQKQIA